MGRKRELEELAPLLGDSQVRLVTLLATGGMGKTRLALAVAQLVLPHFADGVYFVPLASINSPRELVATAADALNFHFSPGNQTPKQQLLNFLRNKDLLLVLDNFEHLLEDATLITEILQAAIRIKVLVTSREKLNLTGEIVYPLTGLPYPEEVNVIDALDYGAVQLFVQCAQRAQLHFILDKPLPVIRICQLVQGMPLAIELAAAWVDSLSPEEIGTEIRQSSDFLRTDLRDVPERLRSVRAVFEASWGRLTHEEQSVFRKLSVFRGGCTRDAAQAVAGADIAMLSKLVNKALLWRTAEGRYEIHELLRQYAAEQLRHSGRADEVFLAQDRHCTYYAHFLAQQTEQLKGHGLKVALVAIESELDNVRATWDWAVENRKATEMDESLSSLWEFYDARSRYHEAEALFAKALGALQKDQSGDRQSILLARVLMVYGACILSIERLEDSVACLEEALTIFRDHDARQYIATCMIELGKALRFFEKRLPEVRSLLQSSIDLFCELGDQLGTASALHWLGIAYARESDWQRSRQALFDSIALSTVLGDEQLRASSIELLGEIEFYYGSYSESESLFLEAHRLFHELGVPWGIALTYNYLAEIAVASGECIKARTYLIDALNIEMRSGLRRFMIQTLLGYALLLETQNQIERAIETLSIIEEHILRQHLEGWSVLDVLERLQTQVPPAQFQAITERGRIRDFDAFVVEVMTELQTSNYIDRLTLASPSLLPLVDPLTTRELEVLGLVASGLSNREIAEQLFISVGTVKWHLSEVYGKLYVTSRTQAVAHARKLNLCP